MKTHSEEYERYIRSKAWESKRRERLRIDDYKCVMCGRPESKTKQGLNVHHINYQHFGDEDVYTDLVTLCSSCHKGIHRYYQRKRARE